jgi:RNA polymerase sigma-70 factor, ECF subfamily
MSTTCTRSVFSTALTQGAASRTVRCAGFTGHGASLFSPLMVANTAADISDRRSLAEGLKRRDPAVLDQLIELYQFRLFRYLLHLTSHRERAEDFFQETWIRVLERGHQYDGKSKFESWLFTIARNLVIDWQRQKKMQSLDTLTDFGQEQPLQVADTRSLSPLSVVMSEEQDSFVRASLQQISLIYREVVVLRFHEELQLEEIAQVMQLPVSTVKTRLYRGLEAMRVAMQGGAA